MVVLFLIYHVRRNYDSRIRSRSAGKTPARILDIYSNFAGNLACFHILGFAPTRNIRSRTYVRLFSCKPCTQRALRDEVTQTWELFWQIYLNFTPFYTMGCFAQSILDLRVSSYGNKLPTRIRRVNGVEIYNLLSYN